jgi:hypothetical protein
MCLYRVINNQSFPLFTEYSFFEMCIHGLVWFGLFFHPLIHTCNIGHFNYSLQCTYYNTTYNVWTSTQYNIINNNTVFKSQFEVESVRLDVYVFI